MYFKRPGHLFLCSKISWKIIFLSSRNWIEVLIPREATHKDEAMDPSVNITEMWISLSVFTFSCCVTTVLQTYWLKTTHIYHLQSQWIRSSGVIHLGSLLGQSCGLIWGSPTEGFTSKFTWLLLAFISIKLGTWIAHSLSVWNCPQFFDKQAFPTWSLASSNPTRKRISLQNEHYCLM